MVSKNADTLICRAGGPYFPNAHPPTRRYADPFPLLPGTAGQELFEPFASRIFEDFGWRPFLFDSPLM